ncbi:hypothetical protein BH09MYX1_BH09MYX1_41890 [soil metagenome]
MRRSILFFGFVVACASQEPVVLPPQEPAVVVLPNPGASATASATPTASAEPIATAPPTPTVTATSVVAVAPAGPLTAITLEVSARDPRAAPRAPALVATEVAGLERLYPSSAAGTAGATTAPPLLRRIAEDYIELRKARTAGAAGKAMKAYDDLIVLFPGAPMRDDVLYFDALEHELAGHSTTARRLYFQLVSTQPTSKWIPFAYFAFGEIFLRDAKTDPSKWALAQQAYAEALKYPVGLGAEALLRSGQVADAQGNSAQAQTFYAKLRRDFPQSPAVARIGTAP